MQASVFKQWYGSRRFTIALVLLIVILAVTLGTAIYSYISAFNTVTRFSSLDVQSSITPLSGKESELSAPVADPANNITSSTTQNGSEAQMNASISTNSNGTSSITVNGTPIEVPENGSVTQQVSNDGNSSVNVQVHSDSNDSDSSRSHSSLHVNLNSSSTTWSGNE